MPGLLRGVARTAVVAGTATAVSNRVSRRQQGRWAAQEGYRDTPPQPSAQQQAAPQSAPESAPQHSDDFGDIIEQLQQLGELRKQGVLTEAEFAEQKRRLLN
ncbi:MULTISPECIES: SHOCT domain-containing protein [Streptomyces]|uniref:SHOCT domain-containing protein n=1 Tax=Streptomyces TaxID=1883 RepID=UPI0029AA413A|nr:SHOCT domain-containing protein [Streptomyces scabiei]MDX3112414.1 SHOCT domain-containing protein [Streptomyces scabiei]